MNDVNKFLSENKHAPPRLIYAKLSIAISLLMVIFILLLAGHLYIYGRSLSAIFGGIPYQFAIYILPLYFFAIVIRKIWSFYIAAIAVSFWTVLFLLLAIFIQHAIFFLDEEYRSVSFIEFEVRFWQMFWLWALSVIVLLLGLLGSAKLLEQKYGRKVFSQKETKGKRKFIPLPELLVIVATVALLMGILLPALAKVRTPSYQMKCGGNLYSLAKAIHAYSEKFEGRYPPADKWCDMLLKYGDVSSEQFKCPQDKKIDCSYSYNPACEPNSPEDTVLLFESIGGWNGHGGQELIKLRHQGKKGCNVLYNDGHAAFVKSEDIQKLNWTGQH
jgi:prepilin-type processing-associated H-X9-DG protein